MLYVTSTVNFTLHTPFSSGTLFGKWFKDNYYNTVIFLFIHSLSFHSKPRGGGGLEPELRVESNLRLVLGSGS